MTVRSKIACVLAAFALMCGAGCGGGGSVTLTAETDEAYYQEGQRLLRQGREAEALSAFLRVIEKRGEQASAESHLNAGTICLYHIKDPIEAIHHFRRYLELQPNSPLAPKVRGLVDTAKREFWRAMPAHPLESQVAGLDQSEQIRQLQRENDQLRSELTALRAGQSAQFLRSTRTTVEPNDGAMSVSASVPVITPAPLPAPPASGEPAFTLAPARTSLPSPVSPAPKANRPTPPPAANARRHTIAPGDTLYKISVKYFGNGSKVEAIFEANRAVMQNKNSLPRVGTELKIP
jgi:tetratricopeptide (TPR) repeat protein